MKSSVASVADDGMCHRHMTNKCVAEQSEIKIAPSDDSNPIS